MKAHSSPTMPRLAVVASWDWRSMSLRPPDAGAPEAPVSLAVHQRAPAEKTHHQADRRHDDATPDRRARTAHPPREAGRTPGNHHFKQTSGPLRTRARKPPTLSQSLSHRRPGLASAHRHVTLLATTMKKPPWRLPENTIASSATRRSKGLPGASSSNRRSNSENGRNGVVLGMLFTNSNPA